MARDRNQPDDSIGRRTFLGGTLGVVAAGAFSGYLRRSSDVYTNETTPVLGAGLNGRPRRLSDDLSLLEASETTWVRAFVDVREKRMAGVDPVDDPDIVALREAAHRKGCNLVVSLKWDFAGNWGRKPETRVPATNSAREMALFDSAVRYLEAIDVPVDALVLGNEPLWETLDADLRGTDPPIVRFTRRLKDHLAEHYEGDPTFLVGAFNRLDDALLRDYRYPAFHERLFGLIRTDDDVAGADLHVHYDDIAAAKRMLAVARSRCPDAVLTATEISPVWRYDRNKDVPMDRSDAGERFAAAFGVAPGTTTVEYVEAAKDDPLSHDEMANFVAAMPWYNEHHVADVYDLLDEYGVSVGCFGFLQGVEMRAEDWTTDWTPFHLNFLFQRALMDGSGAHPYYLADYRRRTGDSSTTLE